MCRRHHAHCLRVSPLATVGGRDVDAVRSDDVSHPLVQRGLGRRGGDDQALPVSGSAKWSAAVVAFPCVRRSQATAAAKAMTSVLAGDRAVPPATTISMPCPVTPVWLLAFRQRWAKQRRESQTGVGEELLFGVVAPVAEQRPIEQRLDVPDPLLRRVRRGRLHP